MRTDAPSFVRWFRDSSPYIHAHRGRTFIVAFGGEAVADTGFANHVHDFALLNSLGIRLVLVHGIRPQIEERLRSRNRKPIYKDGLRITDDIALQCVKEAAGMVRVELEALLSMGVSNSPMAGAEIRAASGNFVIAKPLGVRNGIDFCHTGEVRRIDAQAITEKLDRNNVVLISPVGYSPTGEVFNLRAEEVATTVAAALKADKLIFMMEQVIDGYTADHPHRTTAEAQQVLDTAEEIPTEIRRHLEVAIAACQAGIDRVHLINRNTDGALLLELFTRDGIGALISSTPYETLRSASIEDIGGIIDLITPLEKSGILAKRSREALETAITDFSVIERDGLIIGCGALHHYPEEAAGELACLVLHQDYRDNKWGQRLLEHIESKAQHLGLKRLFVLSTQTTHWFREQGFEPAEFTDLPAKRQAAYNDRRNSKILFKNLL
jgi:amino-acid N-acetyltransferase